MTKGTEIYRRLPGRNFVALQYTRLYLASDHILQLTLTGYSESYKRFYFRDIQGIILRQTVIGKVLNAIWATLAFVPAVNVIAVDGVAAWVLLGVGGFFLLALLVNVARGPTCVCTIRTAVQTERLPALSRIRAAQKFIEQLRPLIVAAQGQIPPEELALRLDESQHRPADEATAPPVIDEPGFPPSVATDAGASPQT